MQTVRRIAVGSAFKVGAALYALLFAVMGLCLVPLRLSGFLTSAGLVGERVRGGGVVAGCLIGVLAYIVLIVVYGVLGGIGGALTAFLYNLIAGWIGGLEVEIS